MRSSRVSTPGWYDGGGDLASRKRRQQVRCAFGAGKCLMVAVNCILDEFDESKLPFTRKAIFLATGRMDRVTSHRRGHLRRQGSAGGYREGGRLHRVDYEWAFLATI